MWTTKALFLDDLNHMVDYQAIDVGFTGRPSRFWETYDAPPSRAACSVPCFV